MITVRALELRAPARVYLLCKNRPSTHQRVISDATVKMAQQQPYLVGIEHGDGVRPRRVSFGGGTAVTSIFT